MNLFVCTRTMQFLMHVHMNSAVEGNRGLAELQRYCALQGRREANAASYARNGGARWGDR